MADDYKVTRRKLTDYVPDSTNANAGSERGLQMIEDSLQQDGAGRSIVADANDRIPAGNKTLEAAVNAGFEDVIEIETDGHAILVHKRRDWDLTDPLGKARRYAYRDNRASELSLTWNVEQLLADANAGVDLSAMWTEKELDALLSELDFSDGFSDSDSDETPVTVPDAIFATDNDYEIPLLDVNLQARSFDLPFAVWGAASRQTKIYGGTYAFYIEDYRFEALWTDPSGIVNSGAANMVEPNFSCYATMPVAIGIYQVYRKRWIARWCQTHGVRVFVDLNVAPKWREINMLGVPKGWNAYMTRGSVEFLHELDEEHTLACERAENSNPLFVVYGGGKPTRDVCKVRGWLWVADQETRKQSIVTELGNGE